MGSKIVLYGGQGRVEGPHTHTPSAYQNLPEILPMCANNLHDTPGLIRDVSHFNVENKVWERAASSGKQGPGRTCHTAAAVGKYKLAIYGGRRQARPGQRARSRVTPPVL